ncbi:MAG: hypothetical protein ACRDJU_13330 [Actinomycetota bacterium]
METSPDRRIAGIATNQYGLVTRRQAVNAGLTQRMIDGRVHRAEWQQVLPGLYRFAGAPPRWPSNAMAAVLAAGEGAVASHRLAASLLDSPNVIRKLEVTVPHGRRIDGPGLIVHRSRQLGPKDIRPILGIPATAPARTIVDLASICDRPQLTRILDDAAARRLLTRRDLVEALGRAKSGKRLGAGMALIKELLDERPAGSHPLGSGQERRLLEGIRAAGLPEPVTQRVIILRGGRKVRLDYAWDEQLFGTELISYRWHSDLQAFTEDAEREAELVALGWGVIRTTATSVRYALPYVIDQITRALVARGVVPTRLQRQ